ncbi:MAG: hypothetical protein LC745_04500 [Planctomycetia bacterium]|nr:hypothetical protein [Planctomycetia bacterium]
MPRPAPRAVKAAALALATLGLLASCGDNPSDPFDDAACERLIKDAGGVDAFDWLKAPSATPKRVGDMAVEDALALAYELEARGAERIVAVSTAPKSPDRNPDLESEGVVIRLPDDPRKRLALFRLYADQIRGYSFQPRADTGQRYLVVPWSR